MRQTSDFWRRTVWAPGWYDSARRRLKASAAILSDDALRAMMSAPDTPSPPDVCDTREGEGREVHRNDSTDEAPDASV
jgi:hypothetical protein